MQGSMSIDFFTVNSVAIFMKSIGFHKENTEDSSCSSEARASISGALGQQRG